MDNSGKTSILLVLENKFSLLTNLSPTKGIERTDYNVLGHPILKWDFGGQAQFRQNYIKDNRFESTDLLFYVIDVQDPDRTEESLQYLSEILSYFRESDQDPPHLLICLHKVDPDLINDAQTQGSIQNIKTKLQDLIDFDYLTYQTTIYYNWSLRKAFSKGLLKLSPKSSLLDSIMNEFLDLTLSDTLLLLDEDALIFSESFRDKETYELSNIIAPRLATMADRLMKYGKEIEVFEGKIGGWIYFKPISIREKKFYVVVFNKQVESVEEINISLPEFTVKIANALQTFFI
ncbi:MAG: hypothetical protein HWN65_22640 [Candidatus Helarchaeota archaeon]|nr:hypothetical protein [Candidatus Helarchaeota archaeon]